MPTRSACSKTRTLRPRLPASIAQNRPAAPPPMTTTSRLNMEPCKRDTEMRSSCYAFPRLESATQARPKAMSKNVTQGSPKFATRCRLRTATTAAPTMKSIPNSRRMLGVTIYPFRNDEMIVLSEHQVSLTPPRPAPPPGCRALLFAFAKHVSGSLQFHRPYRTRTQTRSAKARPYSDF